MLCDSGRGNEGTLYKHNTKIFMAGMSLCLRSSRHLLRQCLGLNSPITLRLLSVTNKQSYAAAEKLDGEKELSEVEKQFKEQVSKLTEELGKSKEESEDYKDRYQRTLADRENVRTRLQRQITEAKQYGIQGFCKDLLEVSDVFRKAIESVPEEEIKSSGGSLKALYDGLVMTENQLLSVFRRHGLEQISPQMGQKFNPAEQEAMFEVPDPNKTPGTVAHIVRTGWKLHDRCIRSSQVGVVKD
ncbi:grpE protein homolog, mitochondrial Roe1 [Oratosquilla oratoria]|uniref:grpE protein homolog, mitochondrial Roe1 n=1 Tax=Oratosquilla oratoria TaxID=337810 RepID=UPI003F76EB19